MKIIKQAVIILLLLIPCFAQDKPAAVQIDSIGIAYCEDLAARLDGAYIELGKNPNSIIYIVIYGKKESTNFNYIQEGRIRSRIAFQKLDSKLIIIAHAAPVGDIKTEIWLVPSGADKPVFEEIKPDFSLKIDKPLIYLQWDYLSDDECPVKTPLTYSEMLLKDESLHGNIVIRTTSPKKFSEEKKWLTDILVKENKVPLKRLKFYYVKTRDFNSSGTEFWLVPPGKK